MKVEDKKLRTAIYLLKNVEIQVKYLNEFLHEYKKTTGSLEVKNIIENMLLTSYTIKQVLGLLRGDETLTLSNWDQCEDCGIPVPYPAHFCLDCLTKGYVNGKKEKE